uniref:Glucan endo-1,3-beta-glucosidase GII n=1 Tax=Aegilops tauschii TaxID=37682 RepID=N1QPY6_AEGTA
MARQNAASALAAALVLGVFAPILTEVQSIGVCNGMLGDNLPSPADVVQFYQSEGIGAMRIYAPDPETLRALDGTGIDLIMDVGNGDLLALASAPAAAAGWSGTTCSPTRASASVSTAVKMSVLASSSPPSDGAFKDAYMTDVAQLLKATGAPLLANVYPYFAIKGDPNIDLSYALFQQSTTTVSDNGLTYINLFDAMVDAVYTAMEKVGAAGVPIVVSESGWPSAGGVEASVENAQTYNQNLINHVGNGTPKRPGPLEMYIFAMFNENQKDGDETEKNFGLFNGPDKSPVYPLSFNN